MPTNLLILPLLGGFCLVHLSHRFRYRAQRLDGYRLLLESALAGAVILLLARWMIVSLRWVPPFADLREWWQAFAPIPYLGTGALALLLGALWPQLDNRLGSWYARRPSARLSWLLRAESEHARDYEIRHHGSALTILLHEADTAQRMVSITLSSRKWYVGYVAESINLKPQEQYFRLVPVLSGYRKTDTLQVTRTHDYSEIYGAGTLDSRNFVLTLPLEDVSIAGFFDPSVYEEYFAPEEAAS